MGIYIYLLERIKGYNFNWIEEGSLSFLIRFLNENFVVRKVLNFICNYVDSKNKLRNMF